MREAHTIIAARIGRRLRELRGQTTQKEFAAALGVSQAQYNRYETGKRLAPDRVLTKVAQTCGLEPEQVAWGQDLAVGAPPQAELAREIAALVELLDPEAREDLYYFLKNKAQTVAKERRAQAKRALSAVEGIRKQAL